MEREKKRKLEYLKQSKPSLVIAPIRFWHPDVDNEISLTGRMCELRIPFKILAIGYLRGLVPFDRHIIRLILIAYLQIGCTSTLYLH
jgi:hypothetical protein